MTDKLSISKARIGAIKNYTPEERRAWRSKGGKGWTKLTDEQVEEIRKSADRLTSKEAALDYGVSRSLVLKIRQGRHRNG